MAGPEAVLGALPDTGWPSGRAHGTRAVSSARPGGARPRRPEDGSQQLLLRPQTSRICRPRATGASPDRKVGVCWEAVPENGPGSSTAGVEAAAGSGRREQCPRRPATAAAPGAALAGKHGGQGIAENEALLPSYLSQLWTTPSGTSSAEEDGHLADIRGNFVEASTMDNRIKHLERQVLAAKDNVLGLMVRPQPLEGKELVGLKALLDFFDQHHKRLLGCLHRRVKEEAGHSSKLKELIDDKTARLYALKNELFREEKRCKELAGANTSLQEDNATLLQELELSQKLIVMLSETVHVVSEDWRLKAVEHQRALLEEMAQYKKEMARVPKLEKELQDTKTHLAAERDLQKHFSKKVEELQAELQRYRKWMEEAASNDAYWAQECRNLQQLLSAEQDLVSSQGQSIAQLQQELQQSREETEVVKCEAEKARTHVEVSRTENVRLHAEACAAIHAVKLELEQSRRMAAKTWESLQEKTKAEAESRKACNTIRATMEGKDMAIKDLNASIERLQECVAVKESDIAAHALRIKETELERDEVSARLKASMNETERLEGEKAKQKEEMRMMVDMLEAKDKEIAEDAEQKREHKEKVARLNDRIRMLEGDLKVLEGVQKELTEWIEKYSALSEKTQGLQQECAVQRGLHDAAVMRLEEKERAEQEALVRRNEAFTQSMLTVQDVEELEEVNASFKQQVRCKELRAAAAEASCQKLEAQLAAADETAVVQEAEIGTLKEAVVAKEAELSQHLAEKEEMAAGLRELKEQIKMQRAAEELAQQLQVAQDRVQAASVDLEKANRKAVELQAQVCLYQKELASLQEEHQGLVSSNKLLQKFHENLLERLRQTEWKLEKATQRLHDSGAGHAVPLGQVTRAVQTLPLERTLSGRSRSGRSRSPAARSRSRSLSQGHGNGGELWEQEGYHEEDGDKIKEDWADSPGKARLVAFCTDGANSPPSRRRAWSGSCSTRSTASSLGEPAGALRPSTAPGNSSSSASAGRLKYARSSSAHPASRASAASTAGTAELSSSSASFVSFRKGLPADTLARSPPAAHQRPYSAPLEASSDSQQALYGRSGTQARSHSARQMGALRRASLNPYASFSERQVGLLSMPSRVKRLSSRQQSGC